jgi:hypothetical protein
LGPEPEPVEVVEDVVEDELVDEDEELVEVDEEEEDDEEDDEHDSVSETTGTVSGSGIEDSGVPVGTFTVNLNCWPPATVTVSRQVSAEATGIAARPNTTSTTLAATQATNSFRVLNNVLQLLQPLPGRFLTPQSAA